MKKGKVFGRAQVILTLMVLALGAAVWLNMKLSSSKYLGEAAYVSENSSPEAVETAAKAQAEEEGDYFETAEKDRTAALKGAKKDIAELIDSEALSDEDKQNIEKSVQAYTSRIEASVNIENLLKAKGFERVLATVSEKGVSVVVASEGLTTAQTLQIQDIVTTETGVELGKIKIVAVK